MRIIVHHALYVEFLNLLRVSHNYVVHTELLEVYISVSSLNNRVVTINLLIIDNGMHGRSLFCFFHWQSFAKYA